MKSTLSSHRVGIVDQDSRIVKDFDGGRGIRGWSRGGYICQALILQVPSVGSKTLAAAAGGGIVHLMATGTNSAPSLPIVF